ncbi:MAG: DUF378 domain-containing protein [Patescibacteria group bacterium]
MKMNVLDWIVIVLVVIGALNWGLVGIFRYDVVKSIFGDMTTLTRIIYTLVGLSGLYLIFTVGKYNK